MAKDDKARVKMTVIHFETDSSNEALVENIKQIAHTIARSLAPPPRVVHTPAQLSSGDGTNNEAVDASEVEDYADAIDVEATPVSSKTKKSGAARQYPNPETIDVDLTSGDMPLRTFLEQKSPKGDNQRYLAIAYWFKHHRSTPEITANHAYTAYREMGWSDVPKDVGSPFRQMKGRKYGYFRSGSVRGTYELNHIGDGVVERMVNE